MKPFSDGYPSGLDSLTYFVLYSCKKKNEKMEKETEKKRNTNSVEITDIEMCLISLRKLFPWTIFSSCFLLVMVKVRLPQKSIFQKKKLRMPC